MALIALSAKIFVHFPPNFWHEQMGAAIIISLHLLAKEITIPMRKQPKTKQTMQN